MADVQMPKLNNNDESYTLLEWHVADAQQVAAGDVLATVETAKATEDVTSDGAGVLRHVVPAGAQCVPGEVIARVVAPGTAAADGPAMAMAAAGDAPGPLITNPAMALIEELSIDLARVRALGVPVVRRVDVERLASETPPDNGGAPSDSGQPDGFQSDDAGELYHVPTVQQAVARTVSRSHQTIPVAYTVVRVDVGAAEDEARRQGMRLRQPVGLPELLIAAVAAVHADFPVLFGTPVDERTVRTATDAHIGITVDAGKGLFVPVVRHASRLGIDEIVGTVGGFRRAAMRGGFRENALRGANLTISLNHDPDVALAIPIVAPGQMCSLAIAGTRPELALLPDGTVASRPTTNLGLAFDHRYVNGRDAVRFLQRVKQQLEAYTSEAGTTG